MIMTLQFLELRLFYAGHPAGEPFPVTVEHLTGVWHCTPRNVKLIINKLSALGWIGWQAGRGRGNASMLTLLADADELLLKEAKHKTDQGDVKDAMELITHFGSASVKDRFIDWLADGLGFSTQTVSDSLQDTLRFPVFRTINTLDPALAYYAFDANMIGQLFDTLVEYDADTKEVRPCIAHSWDCSPDATEWTFHLRKSIMFHHGRELTARDVVYSLDRLRQNQDRFEAAWMFRDVERIDAIDRKTVHIVLRSPNYLFLRFLCATQAAIVPEDAVRADEAAFTAAPVGTGPFRLVHLDDCICILEAFPLHFRGRPHLDRVEVIIFPEQETDRLKQPDWTSVMVTHGSTSLAQQEMIDNGGGEWQDMDTGLSCCTVLVFNQLKLGPHNHPKFREALLHIIDREKLIADLGDTRIYPARGFRPDPAFVRGELPFDKPLGRPAIEALLLESGYAGAAFRLCTHPFHSEDANWIAAACRTFGIPVEVTIATPSEMTDPAFLLQHDCQLFGVVLGNDEVCELELYVSNNYFPRAFDPLTAAAVAQAAQSILREPNDRQRKWKVAQLEERMRNTNAILFLVHKKGSASYHSSVQGISINSYGWLDFRKVWFHPREFTASS